MRIVGLDLAGSPNRTTGFCLLDENLYAKTKALHSDREIVSETIASNPEVVSVDAPLSLPRGRKSLARPGPQHFRACDRELMLMRIRFFPITLGPMRKLTARGIKMKRIFEAKGLKVIESYPGSIQDILGMPRKQEGLEKLRRALVRYGVEGEVRKKEITNDELDAITSAIVGKMFLEGNYLAIGDPEEGLMILPPWNRSRSK